MQSYIVPSLDTRIMGYKKVTIHLAAMKWAFFKVFPIWRKFINRLAMLALSYTSEPKVDAVDIIEEAYVKNPI